MRIKLLGRQVGEKTLYLCIRIKGEALDIYWGEADEGTLFTLESYTALKPFLGEDEFDIQPQPQDGTAAGLSGEAGEVRK